MTGTLVIIETDVMSVHFHALKTPGVDFYQSTGLHFQKAILIQVLPQSNVYTKSGMHIHVFILPIMNTLAYVVYTLNGGGT